MRWTQKFAVTCKVADQPDHITHKTTTGPPSHAVIKTIAEIKDTELERIEPLYTTIDPDALNQLFQRSHQDESKSGVAVSFSYEGYDVTITPAGGARTRSPESHEHL